MHFECFYENSICGKVGAAGMVQMRFFPPLKSHGNRVKAPVVNEPSPCRELRVVMEWSDCM